MTYSVIDTSTDEMIDIVEINSNSEFDQYMLENPDVYLLAPDEAFEEWDEE